MKNATWAVCVGLLILCVLCVGMGLLIDAKAEGAEAALVATGGSDRMEGADAPAEVEIRVGDDLWRGQVERAAQTPPVPTPAHQMGFLFWQIADPEARAWAPYAQALAGIEVTVQNGWAERMSDQYRDIWLPRYAGWAASLGWRFQPYLPVAKVAPDRLAATVWPPNVAGVMAASEGQWSEAQLARLRGALPPRILSAFPEGVYADGTGGRGPYQDFAQRWARVAPWPITGGTPSDAQFRSPFELWGAAQVARGAGIPFTVLGPQLYNSYLRRPEDPKLLRLAVMLAAQATLRNTDICGWGEEHVSQDEALVAINEVARAIREVDALDVRADAAWPRTAFGVYVGDDHTAGYKGSLVMWEALARAGVPFTPFADIREAARYRMILVPSLHPNTWDAGELAWYAARGRTAPARVPGSFTADEEAMLEDLVARLGVVVLTQCGDGGEYGHVSAWPPMWVPAWATPLPSSAPAGWKVTFAQIGVGDRYAVDIARVAAGIRAAAANAGVDAKATPEGVVRVEFVQGGATWTWDVDIATGEASVRAGNGTEGGGLEPWREGGRG